MTAFAYALEQALAAVQWNRSELSRRLGRSTSTVNDWFRETYRPSRSVLSELARVLPEEQFASIVIAHLNDERPPEAADLVAISSQSPRLREDEAEYAALPTELRELVNWLGRRALTSHALRQSLEATRDLLRG
jgi:hypothetical protein